jgi:hypothetical protein
LGRTNSGEFQFKFLILQKKKKKILIYFSLSEKIRSGMLTRPNYRYYVEEMRSSRTVNTSKNNNNNTNSHGSCEIVQNTANSKFSASAAGIGSSSSRSTQLDFEQIPDSLTRIQGRRIGAKLELERLRTANIAPD